MAIASCRHCKRSANETVCPRCGGPMVCDEIYEADEGGAYPTYRPRLPAQRPRSIFWEAVRDSRIETALQEIEKRFNRPPTPLEKAVASIEAQFGKGAIKYANQK